jgi:hypothetical protein
MGKDAKSKKQKAKPTEEKYFKALEEKFGNLDTLLKEAKEQGASKEVVVKLHKAVKKQAKVIAKFEDMVKAKSISSTLSQFKEFLIDNKDQLKEIAKTKSGNVEFVIKAVGAITTANGSNETAPPVNRETELGQWNFRNDNDLLSLCTVTETDLDSHKYTDLLPKDGDFTFLAEGATKQQLDFTWINRFETPRKTAGYIVLTEEAMTDISRLMTVAEEYLRKKHDLKKVDQIFFGDGVGSNPKGATTHGRTFVAGPMALQVPKPNFLDVVNAIGTDIYMTRNYTDEAPYSANITMINPYDYYIQLVSAKDEQGLSLYPEAGILKRVIIGGNTIMPWVKIPSGKIFMADMSKYNVSNYVPFSIRIGLINDQFITNQFTMLGESRFFSYVKELDKQAFVYDDIATVKSAVTKV